MGRLRLSKDIGAGGESRMQLIIDLSLDGKVDSYASLRFYYKEVKAGDTITRNGDILHIESVQKVKKLKVAEDGTVDTSSLEGSVPDVFRDVVDSHDVDKVVKEFSKNYVGPCDRKDIEQVVLFKLLFILSMISICKESCSTAFPCDIGGSSIASAATQLKFLKDKKFKRVCNAAVNTAAAVDVGVYGGFAASTAALSSTELAGAGTAISTAITTASTGTAVVAEGAAIETVATVGGAEIVALSTATGVSVGAEAGGAALAAVGAAAVPAAIIVASTAIAIWAVHYSFSIQGYLDATAALMGYAEYIQNGNIAKYLEQNECEPHEVWRSLADVAEQSGAENIFELEQHIGSFIL